MNFELTEEQEVLRDVSRSMLAATCPPKLVRSLADSGDDVDDRLWHRGTELGWVGMAVSEKDGGAGQGIVELALVAEEIGRAAAPGPFMESALGALCLSRVSAQSGPDHVVKSVLPALVDGRMSVTWTHHGQVSGVDDGDGIVLDGRAGMVHAAASAAWLLVTVRTSTGRRIVLVEASQVIVQARKTLDETRRWYDVQFDQVRVPAANIVSNDDLEAQWYHDAAATLIAADALGVGERLLEMTVGYAKIREQFGRPIGSFQSVKHKAADMLTTLKGARAATYYAAMTLDARTPGMSLAASVAKAYVSEGVSALAGEALQTHGGIGFTWEHDLHLFLRRAKADEMVLGSPAEHYERIVGLIDSAS